MHTMPVFYCGTGIWSVCDSTFDPPQVNWFATLCLACVLVAVVSIYAGAFNPVPRVKYAGLFLCMIPFRRI